MNNTNTENNEHGLLAYSIILVTNKGEPEAIIHSDQGVHYTHSEYRKRAKDVTSWKLSR
ncbi:transposase InsO family protein [Peribacillus huizhouensis]|uniref:Transposase InsO family protein n=1 Tax=Peribacillus huizhouensis TaxID=1501239 RepID=A0ABR6CUX6_9BACI|nr:transposase InsO family protein [Peribacillus huizhouensis]